MNWRKSFERKKIVQSEICPFLPSSPTLQIIPIPLCGNNDFSVYNIWVNHRFSRHLSFCESTSELEVSESYTILSLERRARPCTNDTQSQCSVQSYLFTLVVGLILPPACEIINEINTLATHSAYSAYQRNKTKMQIHLRIFSMVRQTSEIRRPIRMCNWHSQRVKAFSRCAFLLQYFHAIESHWINILWICVS